MTPAAPTPFSLYPELDATALGAFVTALESGDVTGLAPARAAEVAEVRSLVVFTRGKVTGADGDLLDAALWRHTGAQPRPVVVMPSPWTNLGWLTYAVQATRFATRGYNVLAAASPAPRARSTWRARSTSPTAAGPWTTSSSAAPAP